MEQTLANLFTLCACLIKANHLRFANLYLLFRRELLNYYLWRFNELLSFIISVACQAVKLRVKMLQCLFYVSRYETEF